MGDGPVCAGRVSGGNLAAVTPQVPVLFGE